MSAPALSGQTRAAPSARESRLTSVLARASGRFRLVLSERWLLTVGSALVTAGLICVIGGYVGTSRTVLVAGQIPYLVSGGLFGLGLIFLGGFLYFGYWMALMVRDGRERAAQDRHDLALLRQGLADLNGAVGALSGVLSGLAGPAPRRIPTRPRPRSAVALVATENGTMMHRPDCAAAAGRHNLRPVSVADGLAPCGMCRPLEVS